MIVADYAGQETVVGADITGDQAMIESIVDGKDLHCAFARVLYPELKDLSDEEIIKEHKSKRNDSKAPRFCFQFGGTGYTLAMNEGMSIEEGIRIENLFKQLHTGIYQYGNTKLKEAINKGYIEYALGFKLRLPNYSYFNKLHEEISNFDSYFWDIYRIGKEEYKRKKAADKDFSEYQIENYPAYELFIDNKYKISEYFSIRSLYFRLCLNAPTQGTAAHQTKYATVLLFDYIEKNNHYWDVRISNVVHDEIVLEVKEDLCPIYMKVLEDCMKKGGDYFLTNPILKMSADSNIGESWYEAK
jgi:DNA polymerase I-like protein with 3'-5' exonuclease and polymerase domains